MTRFKAIVANTVLITLFLGCDDVPSPTIQPGPEYHIKPTPTQSSRTTGPDKTYDADGVRFNYPDTYSVVDDSDGDLTRLMLYNRDSLDVVKLDLWPRDSAGKTPQQLIAEKRKETESNGNQKSRDAVRKILGAKRKGLSITTELGGFHMLAEYHAFTLDAGLQVEIEFLLEYPGGPDDDAAEKVLTTLAIGLPLSYDAHDGTQD